MVFSSTSYDGDLWQDSIKISEVAVLDTNTSRPFYTTVLLQNPTNANRTFSVNGQFKNLAGRLLTADTTLGPFTSAVLKRSSQCQSQILLLAKESSTLTDQMVLNPNPSEGKFRITNSKNLSKGTVTIFTLEGEEVYKNDKAGEEITLPLALQNGMYIVLFQDDSKTKTFKIILNR